jgi:hypothetical protein
MPNHVHLLLAYKGGKQSLNTIVSNGKRFMAYELVKRLQELERANILSILKAQRTKDEIADGKQHKVFETSFDALLCTTHKFLLQKLNYIHNNPCVKKWNITTDPTEYEHSSASFYEKGCIGNFPKITNFSDLDKGSWANWLED